MTAVARDEASHLAQAVRILARRGGRIKLDRRLDMPIGRTNDLRSDPRLGHEMKFLMGAMEEE